MINAILLNSTSTYLHLGCYLTTLGLKKLLQDLNINVMYEHEVNNENFENVKSIIKNNKNIIIIINGEGTFHDDQRYAIALLNFVKEIDIPFMILNSQFRNMSDEYIAISKKALAIQVRTNNDYEYSEEKNLKNIYYCPDMLFYSGIMSNSVSNQNYKNVIFTDSHTIKGSLITEKFFRNYKGNSKQWVNMHYRDNSNLNKLEYFKIKIANLVDNGLFFNKNISIKTLNILSRTFLSDTESKFINAHTVITGRYHGACLAIALNKPLIFSYSNTSKVQDVCRDFDWGESFSKIDNITESIEKQIKKTQENNTYKNNRMVIMKRYNDLLLSLQTLLLDFEIDDRK